MTKHIDESFRDWEGEAFGFGYGSGEEHVLNALQIFLLTVEPAPKQQYDYEKLEKALGAAVAWLLINALCKDNTIEYGVSPRYGWLTPSGERLRDYVLGKTADQLVNIICNHYPDYTHCYKTACNCGERGYEAGRVCENPFWNRK